LPFSADTGDRGGKGVRENVGRVNNSSRLIAKENMEDVREDQAGDG